MAPVKLNVSRSEKPLPAPPQLAPTRPASAKKAPKKSNADEIRECQAGLTFEEMLKAIRVAFERDEFDVDVDEIWRALEGYESKAADWSKFAYYDTSRYSRNLVDEHEKYNVMVLCWPADSASSIHDHAGAHCFMKVLDGQIVESRYAWPKSKLNLGQSKENANENGAENVEENKEEEKEDENENGPLFKQKNLLSEARLSVNKVLYINDEAALHSISNPTKNRTAASLHVYIPPFEQCKTFDQCTGQARVVNLNFYSKKGRVIEES